MPFSKAWRSATYADYREQGAYIDYKATKEILHRMKEDIANPSTPDELYESLLRQKEAVYTWCVGKQAELLQVAEALYRVTATLREESDVSNRSLARSPFALHKGQQQPTSSSASRRTGSAAEQVGGGGNNSSIANSINSSAAAHGLTPQEARLLADAVVYELLRFVECRNLNTDTLEHIIRRMYRYAALGPTGDRWKNVYTRFDLYALSIDEIFCLLSRVYDRVAQTEERISAKGKIRSLPTGAVGTQVFDRKSVKYWVHMQDLPFVIARIIPHLPLSTYTDTYAASKALHKPFCLYSPVSSIYYDNSKFLFYHRRLERLEGSTLIRMRWYADTYADDWNALSPQDSVFMEIKVHHEAWSGVRSNKRRFAVRECEANKFLHGELSLRPALAKLRAKGASAQQQDEFKSLATEILSKIHLYELKPVLRTQCGRAAFQRGTDQTVRVSIDTNLRLSAEDFGLGHYWRYTGNDAPVSHFPYAVVEIKLQFAENEKMPPWIEELMGCRYMESVPKFSKYAHGIAALYGHTPFISMVPYWMHQLDIDIRAATKPEESLWDPTAGLATTCLERLADRLIFGVKAAQTQTVGASEAQFLTRSDYARNYQKALYSVRAEAAEDNNNSSTAAAGGGAAVVVAPTTQGGTTPQQQQQQPTSSAPQSPLQHSRAVTRQSPTLAPSLSPSSSSTMVTAATAAAATTSAGGGALSLTSSFAQLPPVVQYSVDQRHIAYTNFHLYPYTETGVEAICLGGCGGGGSSAAHHGRNDAAQVFSGKIPWQTGKRIRVPQKYDPKTLLTSERYMAKWMVLATQFGLLGLLSIRFGNGLLLPRQGVMLRGRRARNGVGGMLASLLWRAPFHIALGLCLVGVALLTLVYAYFGFKARARRVYARRKIRYDDTTGPTWLTAFVMFTFAVLAATHVASRYGPMLTGSDDF